MEDFLKRIFKKDFYTFKGLIAGIVLILLTIILKFDNFLEKGITTFKIRCFIYAALLIVWTIIWWGLCEYLPRNPKGKVGLLIAIVTESEKQKIRIKNDLSEGIKNLLKQYDLSNKVNVIVLEDYKANRVVEILKKYMLKKEEIGRTHISLDNAKKEKKLIGRREYKDFIKLNKKLNCHFYVFGKIKERQDIEYKYFIDLEGLVTHKPLEKKLAVTLEKEFVSVFPKEISFPETFEFKGFQLTSDWIFIASMDITGYAALLSGDPLTAYDLHENLENELAKFKPLPPNLQDVANNLKKNLAVELFRKAQIAYQKDDFTSTRKFIYEAESKDNKNYDVLVSIAYFAFNIEKDVSRSLEYLKKASDIGSDDYTWLYNRAFIYMYIGKYEKGFNDYKKLSDIKFLNEPRRVDECIEYNKDLIKVEANKYQLLFILGFLFYFKKRDLMSALNYFKSFKEKACSNRDYDYLCKRVDTYLMEISSKLLSE